jgi:hypothetical protein
VEDGPWEDLLECIPEPGGDATLRFAERTCNPLLRFARWSCAGAVPSPFIEVPDRPGLYRRHANAIAPRPLLDEIIIVVIPHPPSPVTHEITIVPADGEPPSGEDIHVLYALSVDREATSPASAEWLRRTLDAREFRPLVNAARRCEDATARSRSLDTPGVPGSVPAALDGRIIQIVGGKDPRSLRLGRRIRLLLQRHGLSVVESGPDIDIPDAVRMRLDAFLRFGDDPLSVVHTISGESPSWPLLCVRYRIRYGGDVDGTLTRPETLWLDGIDRGDDTPSHRHRDESLWEEDG